MINKNCDKNTEKRINHEKLQRATRTRKNKYGIIGSKNK